MNIPRQHYGLGSLVRKAVKAVTKPVKQIIKSPIGKAALLGATMYGLGGGTFFGRGLPGLARGAAGTTGFRMGNIMPNIMNYMVGQKSIPNIGVGATEGLLGAGGKLSLGKTAIAGSLALAAIPDPTGTAGFNMAKRKGNVEEYLRRYYKNYYKNNWEKGWTQDEEDAFVAKYTSEYNQGGRVGFYAGSPDPDDIETLSTLEIMSDQGIPYGEQVKNLDAGAQPIVKTGNYETQDSKLVERYNEHKQEADVPMSFDEFKKYQSMTAYGGPFNVLKKLGFKPSEISNLFRNLSQMGKEYKTNENFKHLYKLLANPMENKEAIIDIMKQYGKKIPKVLRKEKAIGGIMGGRVGLKVLQDYFNDDEEEYAQGGRIGYDNGGSLAMNEESVPQMWLSDEAGALPKIDGGVLPGDVGNLTIDDFENLEDYMRYLRMMRNNRQTWNAPLSRQIHDEHLGLLRGMNQDGRVGLYTGGDPDDYLEEEDDVTPWELQQEEGVPIGPMAGMGNVMKLFETPYGFDRDRFESMMLEWNASDKSLGLYDFALQFLDMVKRDTPDSPVQTAAQGGRIGALGGGVMGIGTPGMRLPGIPQMAPDGIEFDMRAGGFQNLGAREGKDDVNAKLAKNEFVMTADAVRGAGDGNIEVGAQRMYDTMKRLEGKVA